MANIKELKQVFSENMLLDTPYFEATVIDNADPEGYNRVKVQVKGLTISEDENTKIDEELLPWYPVAGGISSSGNANKAIPPIGSRVLVEYSTDDIYHVLS